MAGSLWCASQVRSAILMSIRTKTSHVLLATFLLTGCVTVGKGVDRATPITPAIDPGTRKAALTLLAESERQRYCWGSTDVKATLSRVATITGPIRHQQSNAQGAGNVLFQNIAAYFSGDAKAAEVIRATLAEGARIDAFTKISPYSPPGLYNYNTMNEPVFQVANFMVPLAQAFAILKEEYPTDTALLSSVRQWGDRLFEITSNARDSFSPRGADRRVLIAAGWAFWGNVTANRDVLDHAYRYYVRGIESIGRGGVERVYRHHVPANRWLYYANMTYGAATVAAYALRRSGANDVYSLAPGGGTLVEGAAWLWKSLHEARRADLLIGRHTGSRGVGWLELFVREFPTHPVAKEIDAWLARNPIPSFVNMGGGSTTCLFRRIE